MFGISSYFNSAPAVATKKTRKSGSNSIAHHRVYFLSKVYYFTLINLITDHRLKENQSLELIPIFCYFSDFSELIHQIRNVINEDLRPFRRVFEAKSPRPKAKIDVQSSL